MGEWIAAKPETGKVNEVSANPLRWSVANRPTPRAVQVLVILTIAAPAVCVGIAVGAVAQILTVNWPKGER